MVELCQLRSFNLQRTVPSEFDLHVGRGGTFLIQEHISCKKSIRGKQKVNSQIFQNMFSRVFILPQFLDLASFSSITECGEVVHQAYKTCQYSRISRDLCQSPNNSITFVCSVVLVYRDSTCIQGNGTSANDVNSSCSSSSSR